MNKNCDASNRQAVQKLCLPTWSNVVKMHFRWNWVRALASHTTPFDRINLWLEYHQINCISIYPLWASSILAILQCPAWVICIVFNSFSLLRPLAAAVAVAAQPFFFSWKEKQKRFVGIFVVDIRLDWLELPRWFQLNEHSLDGFVICHSLGFFLSFHSQLRQRINSRTWSIDIFRSIASIDDTLFELRILTANRIVRMKP